MYYRFGLEVLIAVFYRLYLYKMWHNILLLHYVICQVIPLLYIILLLVKNRRQSLGTLLSDSLAQCNRHLRSYNALLYPVKLCFRGEWRRKHNVTKTKIKGFREVHPILKIFKLWRVINTVVASRWSLHYVILGESMERQQHSSHIAPLITILQSFLCWALQLHSTFLCPCRVPPSRPLSLGVCSHL